MSNGSVPMTEQRAREILGNQISNRDALEVRICWPDKPRKPVRLEISLEDTFTADELEAIAWWMRNKP